MENNNLTKTYGPFPTAKDGKRRYAVLTMKGDFCEGKLIRVEGELYRSTAVTAQRIADSTGSPYAGSYEVTVTMVPATEAEKRAALIAKLRKQMESEAMAVGGDWQNSTGNVLVAASIARYNELKSEIAGLEVIL